MKQIQQQPSIETAQETPYTILHFWDLQYIFFPTYNNKKYCWLKICWSQKLIANILRFFFEEANGVLYLFLQLVSWRSRFLEADDFTWGPKNTLGVV